MTTKGLINLPLVGVGGLCLIKQTLTTVGSQGTAPHWRTLSKMDFDSSTGHKDVTETTSQEDKAKSKASNQQVNHDVQDLPERGKILCWILGQCYDGNCIWLLANDLIRRVVSLPQCAPIQGAMSLAIIFNDRTFVFDQLQPLGRWVASELSHPSDCT
jgi:hypothetical protein